jgi:hypothetical protein
MPHVGSALSVSSNISLDALYQNECWYRMARSNRRCAVSLHEVAKWTVPNFWSVSSCAMLGDAHNPSVAMPATVTANSDSRMIFSLANTLSRFFA